MSGSESIWKKEIHLGRKQKADPKPKPAAAPEVTPSKGGESIWKKEIHLGRKRKTEPVVAAAPVVEVAQPDPVAPPAPVLPAPDPVLEYKPVPLETDAAPVAFELSPLVSFGHGPVELALEPEPEPQPEPAQATWPEPAPESWSPAWELPAYRAETPEPEPVLESEPVAEEEHPEESEPWWSAFEPEPVAEVESFEEPEPAFEPEPVAEVEPAEEPEPWWSTYEPEPVAEVEPFDEPESWPIAFESPPEDPLAVAPEPVAVPEPVVVPEPIVAALSVPSVVLPEPKRHWWDREVSLRRGSNERDASEPAEPSLVLEPKRHWWDREVTLGRSQPKPKAEPEPKPAPEPKAEPESKAKPKRERKPRARKRLSTPSLRRHRGERIVGLKIGGSQIAAACISNNGEMRLERLARTPLQSGVVANGELRDPEALANALRTFFSEHNLPRRSVRLGVASSRIGVRIFEIPGIDDEKQFVNAIRFRAQEALPIPLDEAVLDYRVLDERIGEDGEKVRRVLLVVAHRDLVERYVEACHLAGVTLTGIDLEAFALLRALAPPAEREGSALVAVSIGHERTTLAVSDGRICEFTRVLEWGGWVLNVALARVLDSAPSEVELVKRSLSLAEDVAPAGVAPEQAEAAVEAVRHGVEALARELISSLQYYQSQPGSLGIGEIVVTGGTARLAGLAEELERLVGVPVRVGDPLSRLHVSQNVDESELGSLAIAIGLGIEGS